MNSIEVECKKCPVSHVCPTNGSSPTMSNGKPVMCRVVGGFGRTPIDDEILSEESRRQSEMNGKCLTIAEVPYMDDSGTVFAKVVKIFSQPILAEREKNPIFTSSDLTARSHKA